MTKKELIQNIKWSIEPEVKIPSYYVDIVVNKMIDEIKKAIMGKQKIIIPGFISFSSRIVDSKDGVFLDKPYHCDKKMVGIVKLSQAFQKKIKENSKVI